MTSHSIRVCQDLILLDMAAEGVDIDHPGHGSKSRLDLPIEERAKLHEIVSFAF